MPIRTEDVDRTLQQQDSGVESALLYAKAWSKYTKELLAWVEKRLSIGEIQQNWQIVWKTLSDRCLGLRKYSLTYKIDVFFK